MPGMTFCSESYSPRNAAAMRSDTSAVSRLLYAPRSALIWTTFCDISAAWSPVNLSWVNMSPNPDAAVSASDRDMPSDFAAVVDHRSRAPKESPNVDFALPSVSFRSDAPSVRSLKTPTVAPTPTDATIPSSPPLTTPATLPMPCLVPRPMPAARPTPPASPPSPTCLAISRLKPGANCG